MKKHLLGGVAKGAFGEAEAEAKFEAWKNNKQSGLATLKAKQDEAKKAEAKARLEAEKKINEVKAKAPVSYTHLMRHLQAPSGLYNGQVSFIKAVIF